MQINYAAAYWTPPLTPKLAFDLERGQIEKLDLAPMVSITDHDNINAPMLLRTVPSARQIPVSVEWTGALRGAVFPSGSAQPAQRACRRMDGHAEAIYRQPDLRAADRNSHLRSTANRMCWWSSTIRCGTSILSEKTGTSSW